MKKNARASLRRKLPAVLKEECELLQESWLTDRFQKRARQLFDSGKLLLIWAPTKPESYKLNTSVKTLVKLILLFHNW